jgi:hypothetical protein
MEHHRSRNPSGDFRLTKHLAKSTMSNVLLVLCSQEISEDRVVSSILCLRCVFQSLLAP